MYYYEEPYQDPPYPDPYGYDDPYQGPPASTPPSQAPIDNPFQGLEGQLPSLLAAVLEPVSQTEITQAITDLQTFFDQITPVDPDPFGYGAHPESSPNSSYFDAYANTAPFYPGYTEFYGWLSSWNHLPGTNYYTAWEEDIDPEFLTSFMSATGGTTTVASPSGGQAAINFAGVSGTSGVFAVNGLLFQAEFSPPDPYSGQTLLNPNDVLVRGGKYQLAFMSRDTFMSPAFVDPFGDRVASIQSVVSGIPFTLPTKDTGANGRSWLYDAADDELHSGRTVYHTDFFGAASDVAFILAGGDFLSSLGGYWSAETRAATELMGDLLYSAVNTPLFNALRDGQSGHMLAVRNADGSFGMQSIGTMYATGTENFNKVLVQNEQYRVQQILNSFEPSLRSKMVAEQSSTLNGYLAANNPSIAAVRNALGRDLDFGNINDRIMIGYSAVATAAGENH